MKNIVLLASLLAAGVCAPTLAAEFEASAMPPEIITTLDELLDRSRVSVGVSRESVLTEMREPNIVLPDVWIYTGFRATNVFGGERFDTLVVTFKDGKVDSLRLAKEEHVRVAASRIVTAAQRVAKR